MNGVIANVLNRVLGNFIEDLSSDSLNISLLSGEVTLENLRIKSKVVDQIGLPYKLKSGYIGKIQITIPWTSLTSSPLMIKIRNVFALVSNYNWTFDKNVSSDELIKQFIKEKRQKLKTNEDFQAVSVGAEQDPGFMQRMVTKIVDNIQVDLAGVYIKLEDDCISDKLPFCVGITLKTLRVFTCDAAGNETYVVDSQEVHKMVQVTGFSLFLDSNRGADVITEGSSIDSIKEKFIQDATLQTDVNKITNHDYLLQPISVTLEGILNKDPSNQQKPFIELRVKVPEICTNLNISQLTKAVKSVDYMSEYNNFKQGVIASKNETDLKDEEAQKYKERYKKYKILQDSKNKQEIAVRDQAYIGMKDFERKYTYHSLWAMRRVGYSELREEELEERINKKIEEISYKYSTWWGSPSPDQVRERDEKIEEIKREAQQERDAIQNQITEFLQDAAQLQEQDDQYEQYKVAIQIERFTTKLSCSQGDLSEGVLNKIALLFVMRPNSVKLEFNMKETVVYDYVVQHELFNFIMKNEFLNICVDTYKETRLKIEQGDLEFVGNFKNIAETIRWYTIDFANNVNISKFNEYAAQSAKEYIKLGQDMVSQTLEPSNPTRFHLEIDLKAPMIYLPVDVETLQGSMFLINLGTLNASTQQVTNRLGSYELYTFSLTDLEINTIWEYANNDGTFEKIPNQSETLLRPLNMSLKIYNSAHDNQEHLPMLIEANLGFSERKNLIKVDMSNVELACLIKLGYNALEQFGKIPTTDTQEEQKAKEKKLVKQNSNEQVDKSMAIRGHFSINDFRFILREDVKKVLVLDIGQMTSFLKTRKDGFVNFKFKLASIKLQDATLNSKPFDLIISNPGVNDYGDLLLPGEKRQHLVKAGYTNNPADNQQFIAVVLNNIRVFLCHETVFTIRNLVDSLQIPKSPQDEFEDQQQKAKKQKQKQSNQAQEEEKVLETFTTKITVKAVLREFSLLFPESGTDIGKNIIELSLSPILHFTTESTYNGYTNDEGIFVYNQYFNRNDEGSIIVRHFGICIKKIKFEEGNHNSIQVPYSHNLTTQINRQNRAQSLVQFRSSIGSFTGKKLLKQQLQKLEMNVIQDLILPARVSLFYSSINSNQIIDVFLESIVLVCGVKAVNLFQKLAESWMKSMNEETDQSKLIKEQESQKKQNLSLLQQIEQKKQQQAQQGEAPLTLQQRIELKKQQEQEKPEEGMTLLQQIQQKKQQEQEKPAEGMTLLQQIQQKKQQEQEKPAEGMTLLQQIQQKKQQEQESPAEGMTLLQQIQLKKQQSSIDVGIELPQMAQAQSTMSAMEEEAKITPSSTGSVQFRLDCDALQLTLVDDTQAKSKSLIHMGFSNFEGRYKQDQITEYSFKTIFLTEYYNLIKNQWEPLIEPWESQVNVEQFDNYFKINFQSEQLLQLNVSYAMIETIGLLINQVFARSIGVQQQLVGQIEDNERQLESQHKNITHKFVNKTGIDMELQLNIANSQPKQIQAGKKLIITQREIETMRKQENGGKSTSIVNSFDLPLQAVFQFPSIGKEKFTVKLEDSRIQIRNFQSHKNVGTSFITSAVGDVRNYTIGSKAVVMNHTNYRMQVVVDSELVLEPKQSIFIPLQILQANKKSYLRTINGKEELWKNQVLEIEPDVYVSIYVQQFKNHFSRILDVLQILPPIVIRNTLPCPIQIEYQNSDHDLENITAYLRSGEKRVIYEQYRVYDQDCKISMELEEGLPMSSEYQPLYRQIQDFRYQKSYPCTRVMTEVLEKVYKKNKDIDLSRLAKRESEVVDPDIMTNTLPKIITVYWDYVVVNKTNYTIVCGSQVQIVVNKHQFAAFHKIENKPTLELSFLQPGTTKIVQWSEPFNIDIVGYTGQVSVMDSNQKYKVFGVYVQQANPPMYKTILVNIVPRYYIKNRLKIPIFIQQFRLDFQTTPQQLMPDQHIMFESESQDQLMPYITLGLKDDLRSYPFPLDVLDDFQILVKTNESKEIEQLSTEEYIKVDPKSQYRQVLRVVIGSNGSGTNQIEILAPSQPDIIIKNLSRNTIDLRQQFGDWFQVGGNSTCYFALENPYAPTKRIEIKSNDEKRVYSIESISTLDKLVDGLQVDIGVEGFSKCITIKSNQRARLQQNSNIARFKQNQFVRDHFDMYCDLPGIGISFIDNFPTEQFYISISKIKIDYKQESWNENSRQKNSLRNIDCSIHEIQIDNMNPDQGHFPVIFYGRTYREDEHIIHVKVSQDILTIKHKDNSSTETTIFKDIEVSTAELNLMANQESLDVLLGFMDVYFKAFAKGDYFAVSMQEDYIPVTKVCPDLNAKDLKLSTILTDSSQKLYIQRLVINPFQLNIDFKINSNMDTKVLYLGITRVIPKLAGSIINISGARLYLKEVKMNHVFISVPQLTNDLFQTYLRKILSQLFKVIGCSDLLGNPLTLAANQIDGILDLVQQPWNHSQNLSTIPYGFQNGVRSFIGNSVGGGLESFTNVTASFYTVFRTLAGDQAGLSHLQKSTHLLNGVYYGLVGAGKEFFDGIAGIIKKPRRGWMLGRGRGLIKGIGNGITGLIVFPINAALRLVTSITKGTANTAKWIHKGTVFSMRRKRNPRNFGQKGILENYDSQLADAQAILRNLQDHNEEDMSYYMKLNSYENVEIMLTSDYALIIVNQHIIDKIRLNDVIALELHRDNYYYLILASDDHTMTIKSTSYYDLARLYIALSVLCKNIQIGKYLERISLGKLR